MSTMSDPRPADSALERILRLLPRASVPVLGVKGGARGWVGSQLHRALGRPLVAVAADEDQADVLAADLAFFLGGAGSVLRLPVDEILPWDGLSPDRPTELDRLAALLRLEKGLFQVLVVSTRALARKMPPRSLFRTHVEELAVGQTRDRDDLARRLVALGYQSVPLVEDPGTFAVRGGILDLWSPVYREPLRIEFFGDEVESLRLFDPETQRTREAAERVQVAPAREILFTDESRSNGIAAVRAAADRVNKPTSQIRDLIESIQEGIPAYGMEALLPGFYEGGLDPLQAFLPEGTVFLLDDPVALDRSLEELWAGIEKEHQAAVERGELVLSPEDHFLPREELARIPGPRVELHGLWLGTPGGVEPIRFDLPPTDDVRKEIEGYRGEEGALSPLVDRLERFKKRGIATAIACGSKGQADRLRRILGERKIRVRVHDGPFPTDPADLIERGSPVHLIEGDLSSGFLSPDERLAIFSDEEILGARQKRRPRSRKKADLPFVAAFRELNEGDVCVHVDHGLCRYGGLQKLNVGGIEGDFLVLHFDGKDKLFLPVSKLRQVQKYVGAGAEHVRLDRLGGTSWEKTKKKVRDELLKMAAELLDIYARRKAHPGIAFPQPDRYFQQFEAGFPWEETPDQQKAIDDVIADMASGQPMDRLVCGDVGYGKTEVAMRAAFLAVLGRKQVAVLVPTTILALQHFKSFRDRMGDFPVQVDWVSSLRSDRENREVLKRAAEGRVDIVIGTHALLGPAVSFKDLGLVVVDEEQKFGVKHKERLKKLRTAVDVLTLTATPIPRTLHMSMAGVRDMSIINTPPVDRRSIRTFVSRFSPQEIREAILREKARGGQVYFVHNRVESIGAMQRFLTELVPEASIGVGHGQMAEHALEKVIGDFIDRKYDVLLCTTIIESGLDIPSANTIIVDRADTFGLAQLYQIRGRVGRSTERAYAYLLIPAGQTIHKDAQKRLEVLQRFSDLGSGFHIASHDLEIRGAGNLLGAKQSGQIEQVGFDLYAQLLEEAVAELRGEPVRQIVEPEVTLPVAAWIPDDYLPDVHQRLLFYKKLSQANTEPEIEEVREELVDRCGHPPPEVDALCRVMAIKADLRELGLRAIESGPARLVITLGPDARLDPAALARLVAGNAERYRLTPDMKLVVRLAEGAGPADLLERARTALVDLSRCG